MSDTDVTIVVLYANKGDLDKALKLLPPTVVYSAAGETLREKLAARALFQLTFGNDASPENYRRSAHCKKHRPDLYNEFADDLPMDKLVAIHLAIKAHKEAINKAIKRKLKKRRREVR